MQDESGRLRQDVALACRMIAHQGLAHEIIGHVSARIPGENQMWIRCRGQYERGVKYTSTYCIRQVGFDGQGDKVGQPEFSLPLELPIHGEMYQIRSDVNAVVHAHPTYAVLCGALGLEFEPFYGCFDTEGLIMAAEGLPMYPHSTLINSPERGRELARVLGEKDAVMLRGHGIVTVGRSVQDATLRAIKLERLCKMTYFASLSGRSVQRVDPDEIEEFLDARRRAPMIPRGQDWSWDSYVAELGEEMID